MFDRIDLDKGGTIDKDELKLALNASDTCRDLTDEQISTMMTAADGDANGEIDFVEFRDILQGVKATKAARVIERKFRSRGDKGGRRAQQAPSVAGLSRVEVGRLLGEALVAKMANPKELVRDWDRKHKGAINRIEFRMGVREDLGLAIENSAIDEWFDKIDVDKGGTLEPAELKDALRELQDAAANEQRRKVELRRKLDELGVKIDRVELLIADTSVAIGAAFDEAEKLSDHRALPAIDAKVGEKLSAKLRTPDNPKGVEFEDIAVQWEAGRAVLGWMSQDEFFKSVAACLAEVTVRRQRTEANKLKSDPLGDANLRTSGLEIDLASASLESVNVKDADVNAQFDAMVADVARAKEGATPAEVSDGGAGDGRERLEIRQTLKRMMAADPARRAKDASLFESAEALKVRALEHQEGFRNAISAFEQAEAEEAAADAARAEAEAVAAKEAREKAKASKKAELEAAKTKKSIPTWMEEVTEGATAEGVPTAPPSAPPVAAAAAPEAAPA